MKMNILCLLCVSLGTLRSKTLRRRCFLKPGRRVRGETQRTQRRNIWVALALFGILLGCNDNTQKSTSNLEGYLHFGFFRIVNLYGLPDSLAQKAIVEIESSKFTDNNNDSIFLNTYSLLKKENLLYTPFIELRTDTNSVITIFLEKSDYFKIAPTNYKQLVALKKKLRIKIEAIKLTEKMYRGINLLSVDSVEDNESHRIGKFEIKDYH